MPPKFKTEAEKQLARMQILDAARDLFVSKGVAAVTMREIAKKIGYSPTAIYLHFKDKESLIKTLCITDFKTLGTELASIMQITAPVERMVALGAAYARFALNYPNHYRLLFMADRPEYEINEQEIDPSIDAYQLLNTVVNEVFEKGYFLTSITAPALIAQTIWAGIHGVCSLQISMGREEHIQWATIEARLSLMNETLIRGLLKNKPEQGLHT